MKKTYFNKMSVLIIFLKIIEPQNFQKRKKQFLKKFFILSTVRILRSVTPRTFSARLARSRWKQQPDREDNVSSMRPPRIFEIVQEQHDVSGVAQR